MSSSSVPFSSQPTFFCNNCSMTFETREHRAQHVQESQFHPKCKKCDVRFPDYISYITHLGQSPRHNYCVACEKDFPTAAGFHVHVHVAPIHRDGSCEEEDSDDEDLDSAHHHPHETFPEGWEDAYGAYVYPEANERVKEVLQNGGGNANYADSWPEDEDEGFEDGHVSHWPAGSSLPKQDERSEALLDIVLQNTEHHTIVEILERRFGKVHSGTPSQDNQTSGGTH